MRQYAFKLDEASWTISWSLVYTLTRDVAFDQIKITTNMILREVSTIATTATFLA